MATLMFLAGGLLATTCVAQQFEGAPSSLSFPGLSVDCTHAINTIIKCPSWFEGLRNGQALLHRTQLEDLCADPCTESLGAVKRAILEGCTEDAVIVEDDIAYPATYLVDQYIHGQARYCQVDPLSGQFCDTLLQEWAESGPWSHERNCSDCWLGLKRLDIESPFRHHEVDLDDFQTSLSDCGLPVAIPASPLVKVMFHAKRLAESALSPSKSTLRSFDCLHQSHQ